MRRLLATMAMAAIVVTGAAACGGAKDQPTTTTSPTAAAATSAAANADPEKAACDAAKKAVADGQAALVAEATIYTQAKAANDTAKANESLSKMANIAGNAIGALSQQAASLPDGQVKTALNSMAAEYTKLAQNPASIDVAKVTAVGATLNSVCK